MTTNAHTPTPWEVGDLDHNGQRIVRGEHIEICTCWHHCVGSIEREMEANAAFIVRAVNAHEELVAALDAEEEADRLFDAADEYTHRADAEDWLNDPTGSLHVMEAWDRAHQARARAKELRLAILAKMEAAS